MVWTWPDYRHELRLAADVVIVGSGAGGAPAAYELARHGLSVIILEEGSYVPTQSFTQEPSRMLQILYRNAGTSMMQGKPPIFFTEGRCVGGSTVINGGMCWRTPDSVLSRWEKRDGIPEISPEDMEPIFAEVEEMISAREQDPESLGRANQLFVLGARRLGLHPIPNRRAQIHCMGTNACIFGCPTGAKQSTLVSYIPRALEAGAELYANIRVERLLVKGGAVSGVEGYAVTHRGKRGVRVEVRAPCVVVSCGAIETPALLWRSGYKNRWMGWNLLAHPNAKAVGIYPEPVKLWIGAHQSHQVHLQEEGIILAIAGVPPALFGLALPFVGKDAADIMELYPYMVVGGTLAEDTVSGRLLLGPWQRPIPFYQITPFDSYRLRRGVALMSQLHFAAGAKAVILPFSELPLIHSPDEIKKIFDPQLPTRDMELMTVHLMGTCRYGRSPEHGAVDPWGKLWGIKGCYVADASVFPSPIGLNPQETIMALAIRTARAILVREFSRPYSPTATTSPSSVVTKTIPAEKTGSPQRSPGIGNSDTFTPSARLDISTLPGRQ